MTTPSKSVVNPSRMAYQPIKNRVHRRWKLTLIGVQDVQKKNLAIGLYGAMKSFRQTLRLFTLRVIRAMPPGTLMYTCRPHPECRARGPTVEKLRQTRPS